ncbi:MAG: hypothetical protein EBT60_07335 [Bacteroidetes bacterium]|nr:hypothetical protein [Bacteroidota bacterium]
MTNTRRKPSAWPSIISLSAVMFMLGLLGFSLIGFQGLSKHLMESSSIDLYFLDGTTPAQVKATEKKLQQEPWVKSTKYITPEEGLKEMGDKYDGEILAFAENIALPLSLEIYPKAEYTSEIGWKT